MHKIYIFDDVVHVDKGQVLQIMKLLPVSRQQAIQCYRIEKDRTVMAISSLLLQYALKKDFQIFSPDIRRTYYGKPFLSEYPKLFFNISHCREACAVVIADCQVGIDVQEIRSFSQSVADRVCTENELKILAQSDDVARQFIKMWTIKESHVKMRGTGISDDLDRIDTIKLSEKVLTVSNHNYYLSVAFSDGRKVEKIKNGTYDPPIQYLELAEIL